MENLQQDWSSNLDATSKKVVNFQEKLAKQELNAESIVEILASLLAIEAVSSWLNLKSFPLSKSEVLNLLGIAHHQEDCSTIKPSRELQKFLEKKQSKMSWGAYEEQLEVISALKNKDFTSTIRNKDFQEVDNWVDELRMKLDYLYEHSPVDIESPDEISEFFNFIEDHLKRWYYNKHSELFISCLGDLEHNALGLKHKLTTRFEDVLGEARNQKSSVRKTLKLLEGLAQSFQEVSQKYLNLNQRYLVKQQGNLMTYTRFLSVLKSEEEHELNVINNNFAIAKNTLFNIYKYKIEAQSYSLAVSLLKKLAETNQMYLRTLKKTEVLLVKIQDSLQAKVQIDQNDMLWTLGKESFFRKIKLEDLLKIVEKKIGHTLLSWGTREKLKEEYICSVLLEEIYPIAYQIAVDIHQKLDLELTQKNVEKFRM